MNSNELFIVSIQRSGSNWLHRCLAEHDSIRINGELNVSGALVALDSITAGDSVAQEKLTSTGAYKVAAGEYIKYLMRKNIGDSAEEDFTYLTDKTAFPCVISLSKHPEQYQYCQLLQNYFPSSKKILIIRDARDVIVSFSEWKKQILGKLLKPTPRSIAFFIRHLRNWCLLHERWISDIEDNSSWLIITYEGMKEDFSATLLSVFNFLDLETDETFIEYLTDKLYKIDSPVYQAENKDRGYGFFRKGAIGEWEEKFSWFHKLIYNMFFKSRINNIQKRVAELNKTSIAAQQ